MNLLLSKAKQIPKAARVQDRSRRRSLVFLISSAMATRFARRTIPAVASVGPSPLTKSNSHLSSNLLFFACLFIQQKPRFSSSSRAQPEVESDSTTTTTSKPEKKLADRLSVVIDAVNDRKLPPELRGQRNAVRSETDIINVVEQRIWQSMEEGQFENLPGKGKPLNLATNPHADPAEDTLYRILSQNGCAPEWVELNKEIRSTISEWRSALRRAHANKLTGNGSEWIKHSEALKVQLRAINDKVFRYNLIVPFGRQMNGLKWEKELDRLAE